LSDSFAADIDRFLPLIREVWRRAYGAKGFEFDDWQIELMRRITELTPDGELRWRTCLVSMPRQNGKSEVLTAIALWATLRGVGDVRIPSSGTPSTNLIVASSVEQARITYSRLQHIISANPFLLDRMEKFTDWRGIRTRWGASIEVKASNAKGLQGFASTISLYDEIHIGAETTWDALIAGAGARRGTLQLGITTAGDQNSTLLKRLYENADRAISGDPKMNRFGAWIWEASKSVVPDDDDELLKLLYESNPALQAGRTDPEILINDIRQTPNEEVIRYRLNRFVESRPEAFISYEDWAACERVAGDIRPAGDVVFAIDRSPSWDYASIAMAVMDQDTGEVWTELVAAINRPTLAQLVHVAIQLDKHRPAAILVDGFTLPELIQELELRAMPVERFTLNMLTNATEFFRAAVTNKRIKHDGAPLLYLQIPMTIRKVVRDSYRVSKADSSISIDSAVATIMASYGASVLKKEKLQIW
jgi:phage terminase large subunit-like protein